MNSKNNLQTVEFEVSWSNIQEAIAAMIQPIAKGKISSEDDILQMKLEYPGGFMALDKVIKVTTIVQKNKGVRTIYFGS